MVAALLVFLLGGSSRACAAPLVLPEGAAVGPLDEPPTPDVTRLFDVTEPDVVRELFNVLLLWCRDEFNGPECELLALAGDGFVEPVLVCRTDRLGGSSGRFECGGFEQAEANWTVALDGCDAEVEPEPLPECFEAELARWFCRRFVLRLKKGQLVGYFFSLQFNYKMKYSRNR